MKKMSKQKDREINELKSLLRASKKELVKCKEEISHLNNVQGDLKRYAQRSGTEMFEWKTKSVKLEQEVDKCNYEIERLKIKLSDKQDDEKVKKNETKSKQQPRKSVKSVKRKR